MDIIWTNGNTLRFSKFENNVPTTLNSVTASETIDISLTGPNTMKSIFSIQFGASARSKKSHLSKPILCHPNNWSVRTFVRYKSASVEYHGRLIGVLCQPSPISYGSEAIVLCSFAAPLCHYCNCLMDRFNWNRTTHCLHHSHAPHSYAIRRSNALNIRVAQTCQFRPSQITSIFNVTRSSTHLIRIELVMAARSAP